MSRPRNRSNAGGLVASLLPPWWLCFLLAAMSYFLLDWLGAQRPDPRMAQGNMAGLTLLSLLRGLAFSGKYVVATLFVFVGILSGMRHLAGVESRSRLRNDPLWDDSPGSASNERRSPDQHPAVPTSRWNIDLIRAIEWKRFELLCAGYFEELAFRAQTVRGGPDGGIDVRLFTNASRHPAILVQCKAWRKVPVGVAIVREMLGVMTAENVKEGVIATSGTFTAEARGFAAGKEIMLIDGDDLLCKLLDLSPDRQRSLLEFTTKGDWWTPTCPSCGIGTRMVLRKSKGQGESFWGCSTYPTCHSTMQVGSTDN